MKLESLANKAYTEIRKKILSNQLVPETRLKETVWAEKTGVSRMGIREALTRLYGEGLLQLGDKGGYFVKKMTAVDIHEIRELREIMEVGAIRLAFKKCGKKEYDELFKICDEFNSMISSKYYHGALEADLKFHESLIEFSGNKNLVKAYLNCHIPLLHQKLGNTQIGYDDYEQTDHDHRLIVNSLKDGNLKMAEDTLIKHIAKGEALVLDLDVRF